jgi:hypothetical protein
MATRFVWLDDVCSCDQVNAKLSHYVIYGRRGAAGVESGLDMFVKCRYAMSINNRDFAF